MDVGGADGGARDMPRDIREESRIRPQVGSRTRPQVGSPTRPQVGSAQPGAGEEQGSLGDSLDGTHTETDTDSSDSDTDTDTDTDSDTATNSDSRANSLTIARSAQSTSPNSHRNKKPSREHIENKLKLWIFPQSEWIRPE